MTTTPAGWYDDGQGALRWWDGQQWTDQVHTPDAGHTAPGATEASSAAAGSSGSTERSFEAKPGIDITADEPVARSQGTAERTPDDDSAAEADDRQAALATAVAPPPSATRDEQEIDPAVALGFAEPSTAEDPAYEVYRVPVAQLANGSYPSGYASQQGYPGSQTPEPPKKRSLWWVWLVAGGVVLILLILIAVVAIPALIRGIAGGPGISSTDQDDAIAVVQDYDRAWRSADCELMIASTTENFREYFDLADCGTFEEQATALAATTSDYQLTLNSVSSDTEGGIIKVETTEAFISRFDDAGADTGSEQQYTYNYTYDLVLVDESWLIDYFVFE